MNSSQDYTFAITQTQPLPIFENRATGAHRRVFKDRNFPGQLEKIVIGFSLVELSIARTTFSAVDPETGKRTITAEQPEKAYIMPVIRQAFGTKSFLGWKRQGLVASSAGTINEIRTFANVTNPEELVELVLNEAEALAQRYGVKPEVTYHGKPALLGKYLPQQQPNSQ